VRSLDTGGGVSREGSQGETRQTRVNLRRPCDSPIWGSLISSAGGNTSVVAVDIRGSSAVATVEHVASSSALTTELLYRRHASRVLRYCLRCLRRPVDAEDALQQTFLQAHRAIDRGIAPESEVAWLLTIARNVCLTRADVSSRRARSEVSEDPHLIADRALAAPEDETVSAELQAAFARLPARQRHALFLREWQGCSYAEISATLGTSESATETLVFRARRSLERELGRAERRRGRDLAGLLGWLRMGFGSAASKVAIGAATVTAVTAGTVATIDAQHAPAHHGRPVPVTHAVAPPASAAPVALHRHAVSARHVVAHAVRQHVRGRTAAPSPASDVPRAAPAVMPSAGPAGPLPADPVASPQAAPSTPPSEPATTTPATTAPATSLTGTVATSVDATTNVVSSTVDSVAQTAAAVVPVAAPVATAAAQTVDNTTAAVANTVQSVTDAVNATVPKLLGGH
jgi:RNA polymerase sigma-70 factor (ECF subfamily)